MTNRDEFITGKLAKVCEYGKQTQGKTFLVPEGNCFVEKNNMAAAVLFDMYFRKFMSFASNCKNPFTKEEEDEAIEQLDVIINICEASSETWKLFWAGKQAIDPKNMPFTKNENETPVILDLNEVREIKIGDLGIK